MNKETPGISVIIPAFNEEKNIGACIKALKNQSLDSSVYEIIAVNNASTDKTAEIAKEMGAKVVNEPKKGYVFALDRGFREAKGEYVAVTDADTVVPRDWLENIFNTFKKDKRIGFVGGRAILDPKIILSMIVEVAYLLAGKLFGFGPGFNMAARRDVWEEAKGFDKKVNFNADLWLALTAKRQGRKLVYLFSNPVVSSSRRFNGNGGITYCSKSLLNVLALFLSGKTFFFEFGDVREAKKS